MFSRRSLIIARRLAVSFLPLVRASPATLFSSVSTLTPASDEPGETPGSPEFWYKLVISTVLVLAGGVFAG